MPNNNQDPELDMLLQELMKLQGGGLRQDEMFAPAFAMDEAGSRMGGMGKSMGQAMSEKEMARLEQQRKRLTPEQIHNYGVMYGEPLSQQQIDYFEDQLNRDPDQSYMGEFPQYPR